MDQPSHHFFVSYAWVDDQTFVDPLPTADHRLGWVSTFVDRLAKHLGGTLGRATEGERYWIDYEQMRGGEPLGETIRAQLAAASLLLPILSPGWFASHWCLEELSAFLRLHPDGLNRVFPVWKEPVERADLPPAGQAAWDTLRQVLGSDFWYLDADRQVRTRWFPQPDPTDRDYGNLQQDLARGMAKRLRGLSAAEQPAPDPQPNPQPDPAAAVAPIPGRHLVLVNGGSADADLVRDLAECLAQRGLGYMIPLMAQGDRDPSLKPSALRQDLRENLRLCTAVLMLYRDGPVDQVHEQLREYLQCNARRPKGSPVPSLDLCHAGARPLSFRPPEMQVHPIGEGGACTDACVQAFVVRLIQQAAP
ncbi:toll/interleukin-1 receptor domain-containing protein [uncultured Thiodictyon sp.]|uniref:toll/interleukin-1 receptor domain-containing protein n=1 Tax=uncultured Thiodictyon sp. TaxID=1846217 RepID=UPI0025D3665C|nr:toll/interleukin-1 receptor domain-containing protein [uncultured Thiodictyon sp.]